MLLFKRLNFLIEYLLAPFLSLIHFTLQVEELILPGQFRHVNGVFDPLNLDIGTLLNIIESELLAVGCHLQLDLQSLSSQLQILQVLLLCINLPRLGFLN